ncbi:MAG: amidohydrolase [Chloroflexota bacterium]|nr:amidohydrolase [Chloroflexota bacterium]
MRGAPFAPDLVLVEARVRTLDDRDRVASAVAVKDGRVVAVGADDEVRTLAGPGTRVEGLHGATLVPGLIDPHNHLLVTGLGLGQVRLYECRSLAEVLERVAARARTTPPGHWIVGRGWDESLLAERRHPTRHDLDAVAPEHPVVLHRVWNKLVCNSTALRLAGITRGTPDPPAGERYAGSFERDEYGEPTGLFLDRAKAMVADRVPPPTEEELVAAVAVAGRAYNAVGLTGVADPGLYPHQIRAYDRARREGVLSIRADLLLAGWGFGSPADEEGLDARFAALGVTGGFGDDWLRLAGIKLMPDGGMGDRTARMSIPYRDEPGNRGVWVVEPGRLAELIRWVHDLGWAMDVHTCGDEAQAVTVRAFAAAQDASPKPWLRHRVHHAYFPTPETLRLMAARGIPALVSTPFLANLGESFVDAVGAERTAEVMPLRTYLKAGVPLAGSSDAPITDFDPWVGIHAAVTRRTVAGRELGPGECLSPAEALRLYTRGAAFALGHEASRGTIEPGKLADLVVLDRDPLALEDADELREVTATATMVGGEWVGEER